METLLSLIDSYGIGLLVVLGFAEYGGVPIASVPFLVAAGGLSRMGVLPVWAVVVLPALGGLAADAMWYSLARWKGNKLVGVACSLSPNQKACVLAVGVRVAQMGGRYILTAKFVPGAGNLIAPAAALGNYPARRFLLFDAIALLLWATVYSGLGWIFSDQVEAIANTIERYLRFAIAGGLSLVVLGALYRYMKIRRHGHHEP